MIQRLLIPLLVLAPLLLCAGADDEFWDDRFGAPGANGPIYSLLAISNQLYVAGAFTQIGSIHATNIARWDGFRWWPLGPGLHGGVLPEVYAMTSDPDGKLYAAGFFTHAGSIAVSNVAMWDGTAWFALNGGLNGGARALARRGQEIFVAGSFTRAGGTVATNIAKWNGNDWEPLAGGAPGAAVDSLAVTMQ